MKLIKWFFIVLFTVVAICAGGVYVILTYYKKQLQELVVSELHSRYDIVLKTSGAQVSLLSNWPHASLKLRDVTITSGHLPGSVIEAQSISLSFNIERMLHRQFIVHQALLRDGRITIIKPPERQTQINNRVAEKKDDAHFEIQRVALRNCVMQYRNPANGQDFQLDILRNEIRVSNFSDGFFAELNGDTHIRGLQFRAGRGHFLTKTRAALNVQLAWLNERKSLCIRPGSHVTLNDQRYNVAGVAWLGVEKQLGLIIDGKGLDYVPTLRLLSPRIQKVLNNFDLDRPFDARVVLLAAIGKRQEPAFVVHLAGDDNDLRIGTSKIPYSDLTFLGRVVCVDSSRQRGDIAHAYVEFAGVKGRIYELPFTASVKVSNLINPFIRINGELDIESSLLNFDFVDGYDLGGSAKASLHYAGPTERLNSRDFLNPPMRLTAGIQFNDFSIREAGTPWKYSLHGYASANNRDLQLERVRVRTDAGVAVMKGRAEGFVRYLFGFNAGFKTDLTVAMDTLNLNTVLAKIASNPSKRDTVRKARDDMKPRKEHRLVAAACALDRSCGTFEFNVRLTADHFYIRRLVATKARMHLKYRKGQLDFPLLELRTCDGRLRADGHMDRYKTLVANVNLNDVDVTELFRQFENFGQTAITSENLSGRLHLEASFNTNLDDRMNIAPETMFADVRLRLRDGHLLNFEPVRNLTNFLFKNRDFNDVAFSELNEAFVLRGPLLEISELEIASSLLNLYVVNGVYNFRGPSLINLLVPWNNLRKKDSSIIPSSSGISAESTKGVKLNFSGTPHNMKLGFGHKELLTRRSSI
jgi:hypothetical protein